MPDRILSAMNEASHNPIFMWLLAVMGANFAGLASLLKSGENISARAFAAASLNSSVAGSIIFFLGYSRFTDDMSFLVGVSILGGVGGATTLSFGLELAKTVLRALAGRYAKGK